MFQGKNVINAEGVDKIIRPVHVTFKPFPVEVAKVQDQLRLKRQAADYHFIVNGHWCQKIADEIRGLETILAPLYEKMANNFSQ